ncbi:MAG: redoxin domain-containing protein [Planctomycetes bacterium]|nr:redoxin domain-containing protein [Planctomycetota bacterium]MCW8134073.1 redoxin domain-containing protein [Planctomycetota bacterium]
MKSSWRYLTPFVITGMVAASVYGAYLFAPKGFEECCEYLGLLAPEGVSEVPGVEHAAIEQARDDGGLPDSVPGLRIGDKPEPITLPDLHGVPVTIDFGKPTAVVWVSSYCPTSKIYEERLNKLAADFPGVQWFAINSSAMEGVPELIRHFEDGDANRLKIRVLKDEGNAIADRFGARVTTETYIFTGGELRYRGAIDDARNPQSVEVEYLRKVLSSVLAGRNPPWRYQPPKGCCPIDKLKPAKQ